MATEASIIIEFGDDVVDTDSLDSTVVVELDGENDLNLDEDGSLKSTFGTTEQPVFIIHHGSNVQIDRVACSHGSVVQIGSGKYREKEETVSLTSEEDNENTLGYANVNSYTDLEWFGNSAVLSVEDSVIIPKSGSFPCHGKMTYQALFQLQYQLLPPTLELEDDETYEILIVVYASKVEA